MITEIRCVVCRQEVYHNYKLKNAQDDLESRWFHCACGCVFNLHKPDLNKVFNEDYQKKYLDMKEAQFRYEYYLRLFAPIVEEKTYGRKFLDVGFCCDFIIQAMRKRGWISTGIDLIKNNYITGDFITANLEGEKFDFIFMADFLQCVDGPQKALNRAYELLNPTGLLFIVTPNTDLIRQQKVQEWGHWDMEENRQFFSEELLSRMIGKVDKEPGGYLKVIYKDSNISNRFISWNNLHILAQKIKIEE